MNKIEEKFIPIGTVVKLKKSDALLMIVGYGASFEKSKEKKYDYIGYVYPIGFNTIKDNYLFNYEDIEKIVFKGYIDNSYMDFLKTIGGEKNDR